MLPKFDQNVLRTHSVGNSFLFLLDNIEARHEILEKKESESFPSHIPAII